MGQAKRKEAPSVPRARSARSKRPTQRARREARQDVLDESAVERVLEQRFVQEDGDPAAGVCRAALLGAAVWASLAFVLI
jgi:hypothetical protein